MTNEERTEIKKQLEKLRERVSKLYSQIRKRERLLETTLPSSARLRAWLESRPDTDKWEVDNNSSYAETEPSPDSTISVTSHYDEHSDQSSFTVTVDIGLKSEAASPEAGVAEIVKELEGLIRKIKGEDKQ